MMIGLSDINILTCKPLVRARRGKGKIGLAHQVHDEIESGGKVWPEGTWVLFGEESKILLQKEIFSKHYKVMKVLRN